MEKTGYWEVSPGNKSNGRRNSTIVVFAALLMAQQVLLFGFMEGTSMIQIAASAGTIFLSIATPALVYMFSQKKQEIAENKK